jgi:hypothetical protein
MMVIMSANIIKQFKDLKSSEEATKLLTFNFRSLYVTLTFGIATWILDSSHYVITVAILDSFKNFL